MGVEAASATGDHRAFLAGLGLSGQAVLTGGYARVLGELVQGVAEDVQPGGGPPS
jgi:hypothetical protein